MKKKVASKKLKLALTSSQQDAIYDGCVKAWNEWLSAVGRGDDVDAAYARDEHFKEFVVEVQKVAARYVGVRKPNPPKGYCAHCRGYCKNWW